MATYNLQGDYSHVVPGLGTWVHTAEQQSTYYVSAYCNDIPPSGLTITIQQNGTPKASATILSAGQQVLGIDAHLACLANDVISVILSSSSLQDEAPNTLKTIIVIRRGL